MASSLKFIILHLIERRSAHFSIKTSHLDILDLFVGFYLTYFSIQVKRLLAF